jgi:hypothetical protein
MIGIQGEFTVIHYKCLLFFSKFQVIIKINIFNMSKNQEINSNKLPLCNRLKIDYKIILASYYIGIVTSSILFYLQEYNIIEVGRSDVSLRFYRKTLEFTGVS